MCCNRLNHCGILSAKELCAQLTDSVGEHTELVLRWTYVGYTGNPVWDRNLDS